MSRQVGDLAGKIGVQVFQFLDAGAEFAHQSVFGRCGHRGLPVEGATVALGFAGVDDSIRLRSAQPASPYVNLNISRF